VLRDATVKVLAIADAHKDSAIRRLQDELALVRLQKDELQKQLNAVGSYGEPQPTWTNSDGNTFRLKDLPTKYLVNITNKLYGAGFRTARNIAFTGRGTRLGIMDAIQEVLNGREQR
jgi:hypothetical protein